LNKNDLLNLQIDKPNKAIYDEVKLNWDHIAKPLNGLGDFEEIICKIGAVLNTTNVDISNRAVVMMCADNGIIREGVSQSDESVTLAVTKLMGLGQSSVCKMAKPMNVKTVPIDIGVLENGPFEGVLDYKVSCGTKNFAIEPAMSEAQTIQAIEAGIEVVGLLKSQGITIIATGEMGIGNTTTSAALIAAILNIDANKITGRGAGLSDSGLQKKISVIETAIEKYDLKNKDAIEVLATVGGLDIAGLCGVFLGGAIYGIPIIIDGLISASAALVAAQINENVKEFMLASHMGRETGMKVVLEHLGIKSIIDADMALGEGSGAIMLFPLLDMALALYSDGTRFADTSVEQYERFT